MITNNNAQNKQSEMRTEDLEMAGLAGGPASPLSKSNLVPVQPEIMTIERPPSTLDAQIEPSTQK